MTVIARKIPALRFPEFEGEWCLDEIKDYLEEYTSGYHHQQGCLF